MPLIILLLQCGFNLPILTCFDYEMNLVIDIDMRPFGIVSYLIEVGSCQFSYSVLNYFSPFDPRLCPSGLPLMFEALFQVAHASYTIDDASS